MARERKINSIRNTRKKVRSKSRSSDDSDEDYVAEYEESTSDDDDLENFNISLDRNSSDESIEGMVEVPKANFSHGGRSKRRVVNRKVGTKNAKKRKVTLNDEGDASDDEDYTLENDEDLGFNEVDAIKEKEDDEDAGIRRAEEGLVWNTGRSKKRILKRKTAYKCPNKRSFELNEEDDVRIDEDYTVDNCDDLEFEEENIEEDDDDASIDEEDEDEEVLEDEEFSEEDDDDEFTCDEDEEDADEEEYSGRRRRRASVGQRKIIKRNSTKRCRKPRTCRRSKSSSKESRRTRRLIKQDSELKHVEIADLNCSPISKKISHRRKPTQLRKRSRFVSNSESDSDFLSSKSSAYVYTISEEEREQVKEANRFCGDLITNMRSSSSIKGIDENGNLKRKGKEKANEIKAEVVKQVCGICLSEEDKRRSKGALSCCTHYFCFACIMEWAKVESRCPLCKQRFTTITKRGRSANGLDLRNVVIEVPERDQVYQPTEEEIRNFIDPYENVICTECHEGGDDGLMLLCDICDSPAHTYCVGLGRQVPEGNWYCDGCRPVAHEFPNPRFPDPLYDQRGAISNINRTPPFVNGGESSGLPYAQGLWVPSSRYQSSDGFAASPASGAGAATLSGRRQILRHIQHLFSNRMGGVPVMSGTDMGSVSVISRAEHQEEAALRSLTAHEIGILRDGDATTCPLVDSTAATNDCPPNLTLWPHLPEGNNEQAFLAEERPNLESGNMGAFRSGEDDRFYSEKEQLHSMVISHVINMSKESDLVPGDDAFKEIVRSSTHTILAACGHEHRRSEVQVVAPAAVCAHRGGEGSMMKGFCSSCFDSFVREVVKRILDTRSPQWLTLGL